MYAILVGVNIGSSFETIRDNTTNYMFFIFNIVACIIAMVLIRQEWLIGRDLTILLLTCIIHALTITQIQVKIEDSDLSRNNHFQTVVAANIAFSIFNRRGYSLLTVLVCCMSAGWYLSVTIRSG